MSREPDPPSPARCKVPSLGTMLPRINPETLAGLLSFLAAAVVGAIWYMYLFVAPLYPASLTKSAMATLRFTFSALNEMRWRYVGLAVLFVACVAVGSAYLLHVSRTRAGAFLLLTLLVVLAFGAVVLIPSLALAAIIALAAVWGYKCVPAAYPTANLDGSLAATPRPTSYRLPSSVRRRLITVASRLRSAAEWSGQSTFWWALAFQTGAVLVFVLLLRVLPQEGDQIARVALAVLVAPLFVGFGFARSWRRTFQAWILASLIAPVYLALVVLVGLEHFGGWFDVAFVVVYFWGVVLAGAGALVGRLSLHRRNHDT